MKPPVSWVDLMSYAKPEHSIEHFNAAGRVIRDLKAADRPPSSMTLRESLETINNWRAAHAYPLNALHMTLRNRASKIDRKSVTSQRIKRLISIINKLWERSDMKLSQMQDIGGCRAVMPTIAQALRLREHYADRPLIHTYLGEKDYVAEPKDSGYRSVHLKYRYTGKGTSEAYDKLKIEIQIRSALQHTWATAVEAAGTITETALKSSQGHPGWLRFFALMSSVFALRELCPTVPGTPESMGELHDEIRDLNQQHYIESSFAQYRAIIPHIEQQAGAKYFLVTLDPAAERVNVRGFRAEESKQANAAYTQTEAQFREHPLTNVVLVSVSSIRALKRAYPNYFLDTEDFLREVRLITG